MTLEGLKVAFVAGTLGQGGAERQLYYALKALAAHGARPSVVALTRGEHWEAPISALGVPVLFAGASRGRLARAWDILGTIRRLRPNVVQSFHFYTNLYAAVAARAIGVPSIGALRSDGANELRTIGATMARWSLGWPNIIAANSPVAIANVEATGCRTPLVLLNNAIDLSQFVASAIPPSPAPRIAAIGRLGPEKRFDRLLRVVSALVRHQPATEARIAGAGPLRDELTRTIAQLGLDEHVRLIGPVDDVRALLEWSTCTMLTSDFEGTPNVLLEAMAVGRPIVATRVGGVPGLVTHEYTGLLAGPEDEGALAESVARLHADPRLAHALVAHARQYVVDHHSLDRLASSLSDLYARVA